MSVQEKSKDRSKKGKKQIKIDNVTKKEDSHSTVIKRIPDTLIKTKPSPRVIQRTALLEPSTPVHIAPTGVQIPTPAWGYPNAAKWMYTIPFREHDKAPWAHEWADYLLSWAKAKNKHILSLATFIEEVPFRFIQGKIEAFQLVAGELVNKDVARWLDEKERQLRVYWRPLEDWADLLYQWALQTGRRNLDVKSIIIQESGEEYAALPERDLHSVLGIIVERGLAQWIDKQKGAVSIEI